MLRRACLSLALERESWARSVHRVKEWECVWRNMMLQPTASAAYDGVVGWSVRCVRTWWTGPPGAILKVESHRFGTAYRAWSLVSNGSNTLAFCMRGFRLVAVVVRSALVRVSSRERLATAGGLGRSCLTVGLGGLVENGSAPSPYKRNCYLAPVSSPLTHGPERSICGRWGPGVSGYIAIHSTLHGGRKTN